MNVSEFGFPVSCFVFQVPGFGFRVRFFASGKSVSASNRRGCRVESDTCPHPPPGRVPYTLNLDPNPTPDPNTRNPNTEPGTRNLKHETRNPKLGARTPKPETRNPCGISTGCRHHKCPHNSGFIESPTMQVVAETRSCLEA